jgi:hypothetical protein
MVATQLKNGRPYAVQFDRARLTGLVGELLKAADLDDAAIILRDATKGLRNRSHWRRYMRKLARALELGQSYFPVFQMKGNTKLPFASFSTLPIFTCPGAGECAVWCYSLKAWRYPGSFLRQLQNTLLLKKRPALVETAFMDLPESIDMRLYVDGDFDSLNTVKFWMRLLTKRPDIRAYGYSKSWEQLWAYGLRHEWPANYVLNLSTGGSPQKVSREDMLRLPVTRGEFISLPIHYRPAGHKGNIGFDRYNDPLYHATVRQAALDAGLGKVFSCPGNCGKCTAKAHACGDHRFDNITIVNGVH